MIDLIAQEGASGMGPMMIAMLAAFVVMIFMQSRSQKKHQRAYMEWIESLKKNDKIVTKSGMYGTITSIRDDSVMIKIDDDKGIKMQITKESISHAVDKSDSAHEVKK